MAAMGCAVRRRRRLRAVPESAAPLARRRTVAFVLAAMAVSMGAADDRLCSAPTASISEVRFVADAWIDEAGLRAIAGLEDTADWSEEREAAARAALLRTEVFRSVETRRVWQDSGCVLIVDLDRRPTVLRVHLSGASQSRFAAVGAFLRWATRNEERAPPPRDREIRRLLRLRPGTLFDEDVLDRGTQRIVARYHAAGFQSARVSSRVRECDGSVEIFVNVDPGEPLLVTSVQAEVNDAVARQVVDEVLRKKLGAAMVRHFQRNTRREIVRRLRAEGYFDSHVDVRWRPIDATSGELLVAVEAGPRRTIEVVGNESISEKELLQRERLDRRVFITSNTWRQMAREMEAEYQRRGYFEAEVEVDSESEEAIIFRVQEGARFKVEEVRFEGNETLDAVELRTAIETGYRGWLAPVRPPRVTEEVLAEDIDRVRERYLRAGFEATEIEKSVALDYDEGSAVVTFTIDEGPRTTVRSVARGAVVTDAGAILEPAVTAGEPLDIVGVEQDRDRLSAELRRAGYRDAVVDFAIERESADDVVHADITWQVDAGPLHRFGDVVIQGNGDVQYVVITRDLSFDRGDAIETDALLDAQQRIYDSAVFQNVSIAPVPRDESPPAAEDGEPQAEDGAQDETRTVAVNVAARSPGRFGYGIGYDTRQGVTGFTELTYGNLNHRAQKLRLRAQVGIEPDASGEPTQYQVTAGFSEPRLLDGKWDFHVNTVAERNTRTIDQYNIERVSGVVGSSRPFGKHLRAGADLQGEHARVFDVDPVPFLSRDERDAWTTSLSPYLVYDRRDSVFDPRAGFFESLRLRYAVPGLSTTDFVEVNAQHTHLIPLWWDWGFVYSLRAGWVHSLDGDPIVPIRQRYFVGGGESVRGFAVNTLGPYDGNGNELGGDLAVVLKTELRIPLYGGLGWVLFVDGGGNYLIRCDSACRAGQPGDDSTTIRDAAVTLDNFRRTAGMGLRYVTPIGPISVDYGIKLDRRTRSLADGTSAKESFGEFSVSIGARF